MANKAKNITIPESLWWDMVRYCLVEECQTEDRYRLIEKGITAKLDRMAEHEAYTKYKTAPTPQQREEARKEYLERKGIHHNFVW